MPVCDKCGEVIPGCATSEVLGNDNPYDANRGWGQVYREPGRFGSLCVPDAHEDDGVEGASR